MKLQRRVLIISFEYYDRQNCCSNDICLGLSKKD
jgi:hypothetical protein